MFRFRGRKPVRGLVSWSWVATSLLVSGIGCGNSTGGGSTNSNGGTGGGAALCVPGIQIACACSNGAKGAQACKADGSGFGACLCSSPAGGGSSSMASGGQPTAGDTAAGAAGEGGDSGAGAGGEAGATLGSDFPEDPIVDDGVPADAPELFAAAADTLTSPLCVLEPQLSSGSVPGAMFPSNWLRPRFRLAAADFDLYEIRLHSAAEGNDLVVYTKKKTWYLPSDIWHGEGSKAGLGAAAAGSEIRVTIRALNSNAPLTAARVSGNFNVAPAVASGSILFPTTTTWAFTPDFRVLGFSIGDEGVQAALKLQQVSWSGQLVEDGAELNGYYDALPFPGIANGQVRIMSRPTLTPDGQALAFVDDWPYALGMAQLSGGPVGSVPSYVGKGAQGMLRMPWLGSPAFSPAHWAAQDRILISSYGSIFKSGTARSRPWQSLPSYASSGGVEDYVKWHQLVWFDLEARFAIDLVTLGYGAPELEARNAAITAAKGSSWGIVATGDTNTSHVTPSFNPAGDTLAYVATDYTRDGYPSALATKADVRLVPYNSRAGGTSQPLVGASEPSAFEYEPTFSPDGKLIAFSRAATGGPDGPYRNRHAELSVVPASGGDRARLLANDPSSCAADPTPLALLNGSPAWGPNPVHHGGRTYYFLLFTSARKYGDEFATQSELDFGLDDSNTLHTSTQIYLTTIVVDDATGRIESYPAIYVWNQNRMVASGASVTSSNMTPLWGTTVLAPLAIPKVP